MNAMDTSQYEDGQKFLELIAKATAALTVIGAFCWKVVTPLLKWFNNWSRTGKRIEELVTFIHRELKPNGMPICDKIADIQGAVKILMMKENLRFENSPIPSYECDKTGACIQVNPAWIHLFGVEEKDMHGNGWLDVIESGPERDRVLHNWETSVKNRFPHREKYRATNRKTGETLWCESSTITYTDKLGEPILYFGTIKQFGPNWTCPTEGR